MAQAKLIVASARLPLTLAKRGDNWVAEASTGGLVTALQSIRDQREFSWIGWCGAHVPESERAEVGALMRAQQALPLYLGKAHIEGFYDGFSNGVLWPLFHNQQQRARFDLGDWAVYRHVNALFADAICRQAEPGDIVWVHDYQLALVPEMLRERGLSCAVGFFLHIPFPSAETYRTLPVREAILRGILGADLVGFHSYEYVSHFRSSCLRVLGLDSEPESMRVQARTVQFGIMPIGIDPDEVRAMARGPEARAERERLEVAYRGKKIIVAVDRLDYTKGIPQKLLAFEELLRTRPKWRQRVVLVQVAAPTRTDVADYQELKREVDELVGRINGRYSSPSFMPVVYINQSVARDRLVGLYQAAHVALITPVRDGMNLVALEYVAARGERGGTLILSEFAGAAHCLPGARLVNPYSSSDVANALAHVLEGEGGPSEGFSHMLEFVETNTASRWATSFLARLEETTQTPQSLAKLLDFSRPPLRERALTAKRPLLLLDYDGTLRSFVTDPNDAVPEPRLLDVLRSLTATSLVYVVSGRSAAVLEGWLGKLPIGLVCEHGLAERPPGGSWRPRLEVDLNEILELVGPLLSDFRRNTPGSSIERKQAAVAWHYRGADPEFGAFQANALLPQLEDRLGRSSFKVLRGSRVIEVRHADVSKGRAVEELLERHADSDFVLCAGDDHTDEQMMEAIRGPWRERSITSWVGSPNAHAEYFRESCHKFVGELEALDRLLREARGLPQPAPSRPRSHAGAKASPAARASAQHDSGSPRPR